MCKTRVAESVVAGTFFESCRSFKTAWFSIDESSHLFLLFLARFYWTIPPLARRFWDAPRGGDGPGAVGGRWFWLGRLAWAGDSCTAEFEGGGLAGGGGGGGGRRCPSNVGGSSSSPASHSVIRVRYSVSSLIRSSSTACPVTRAWTCSLRLSTRSSGDGPPLIRLSGRPRNTGGHPSLQSYICWMTRSIWSMMTLRSPR